MKLVMDTNVGVVANGESEQASLDCFDACVDKLLEIQENHTLVLDNGWEIMREYENNLHPKGQKLGTGHRFWLWLQKNLKNPVCVEWVTITLKSAAQHAGDFCEFPDDADLAHFDLSDRKFVAVALAHADKPPVLNAVDSDWWNYRQPLAAHGVRVEFLCPNAMPV